MKELLDSPQAIVLGGGLSIEENGQTHLSPNSQARAIRTIELYKSNPEVFDQAGSVIVCTGNSTRLSDEKYSRSEASLMADALLAGEIPHHLIETEDESNNTLTNFLNSADVLDAKSNQYSGDSEPVLTIVTQGWHYSPRAHFLGSVVLDRPTLQNAEAKGEAGLKRRAQEIALYSTYRLLLAGVEPGDKDAIVKRAKTTGRVVSSLKTPLHRVWE